MRWHRSAGRRCRRWSRRPATRTGGCVTQPSKHWATSGQDGDGAVGGLIESLGDPDEFTRRNAALALARIGPPAADAVPALGGVLRDEDRYVRGKALEALRRIDTPAARDAIIDDLLTSRWCEITTKDNLY